MAPRINGVWLYVTVLVDKELFLWTRISESFRFEDDI